MATTKKTTTTISSHNNVHSPAVKRSTKNSTKNSTKPASTRLKKDVNKETGPINDSLESSVDTFESNKRENEDFAPSNGGQGKSRIIKKYPNRRLYDTLHSTYVTLFDIKGLVMSNIPFHVVDAKTGDDLTRSILMQIILEEEAGGQPILSKQSLLKMIRFYGNSLQGMMAPFLEQNLNQFIELQNQYVAHCQKIGGLVSPETWVSFVSKQNTVEFTHPMSFLFETGSKILEQIQSQSSGVINSFPFKK